MGQAGDGFDFEKEAVSSQNQRYRRVHDLYSHFPIVPEVVGEVHRGHAAASDLTLDPVAVSYVPG